MNTYSVTTTDDVTYTVEADSFIVKEGFIVFRDYEKDPVSAFANVASVQQCDENGETPPGERVTCSVVNLCVLHVEGEAEDKTEEEAEEEDAGQKAREMGSAALAGEVKTEAWINGFLKKFSHLDEEEKSTYVLRPTKRPVTVEAMHWDGTEECGERICRWTDGRASMGTYIGPEHDTYRLEIDTLEGIMVANVGGYIIKGVKGEFYPCDPEVFEETYSLDRE